jgi:hypothetical protein
MNKNLFSLKKPEYREKVAEKAIVVEEPLEVPLPSASKSSAIIPSNAPSLDLGAVMDKLVGGDGGSAVEGVMELTRSGDTENSTKDLAMKSNIPHIGSYSAAQVQADFNEDTGFPKTSKMLRTIMGWQYVHGCGLKGADNRAKQAFNALTQQVQQEFLLEKETKGLMKR